MKKVYTAPQILFESFAMSTNIAAGCEAIVGNPTSGVCAFTYEDEFAGTVNIFTADVTGCKITEVHEDGYNGFCYHNPVDSNNLFNS